MPYHVLFLCTGNSARSILAEAYLNAAGTGRFIASSAGSQPAGRVNPFALELLGKHRLSNGRTAFQELGGIRKPRLPELDFVFTVCDNAAGETCPLWPGQPLTAHWGVADPAAVQGSDDKKRRAFLKAFTELSARINLMLSLPMGKLDRLTLGSRLKEIGKHRAQ